MARKRADTKNRKLAYVNAMRPCDKHSLYVVRRFQVIFGYHRLMCRVFALILLALAPLRTGAAEPLTKYFVAFLYKGPRFAANPADSPERKLNHEQHLAYIDEMEKSGKMLLFGPISDAGDLRGMYVFKAASIEEAREWADREPSVKIGMIEMRVYPWFGPSKLSGK